MPACRPVSFLRSGWRWRMERPDALDPWVDAYLAGGWRPPAFVKSDERRRVFRVQTAAGACFVKHDHPADNLRRLKSFLIPSARSEREAARLLEAHGLPCVAYAGWGRRGTGSMLVSFEESGASDARLAWLALDSPDARSAFLRELSRFLRAFAATPLRHPDLHLGNLLTAVDGGTRRFLFVDPHGLVSSRRPDPLRCGARGLAAFFRSWLSLADGARFMDDSGLRAGQSPEDAWRGVIAAAAAEVNALWPKRLDKVFAVDSRFTLAVDAADGSRWLVRRRPDGEPCLPASSLAEAAAGACPGARLEERSADGAPRAWALSWWLAFHGIRHPQACAMRLRPASPAWMLWGAPEAVLSAPGFGAAELLALAEAAGATFPAGAEAIADDPRGAFLRSAAEARPPASFDAPMSRLRPPF